MGLGQQWALKKASHHVRLMCYEFITIYVPNGTTPLYTLHTQNTLSSLPHFAIIVSFQFLFLIYLLCMFSSFFMMVAIFDMPVFRFFLFCGGFVRLYQETCSEASLQCLKYWAV